MSQPNLTIAKLSEAEENKFLIQSSKEIQLILRAIAQKESDVAVYFNEEQSFIRTTLLAADQHGVWVDVGPNQSENKQLLKSSQLTFVTTHLGAKVQFVCNHVELSDFDDKAAFYCPLPRNMLRLQRRDYFRIPVPLYANLRCYITPKPPAPAARVEVFIVDISVGGLAFSWKGQSITLQEGETYPDCEIILPEIGTITATLHVKNLLTVTLPSGLTSKQAGCEFVQLDGKMSVLLQRYISVMQSSLSKVS